MDDEKAVEVIHAALAEMLASDDQHGLISRASADMLTESVLAAIRAQGGEVVWWGDDMHKPTGTAEGQHFSNFPVTVVCENKRAILRGPEVKP